MGLVNLRALGKFLAMLVSVVWLFVTIYQEFFDVDPLEFGFKNPEVQMRLQSCSGTFLERYQCKDEIIIEKGREDFLVWIEKVAWIFGPPGLVFALYRLSRRRSLYDDDDDDFEGPGPLPPPPRDISHWRVK